MSHAATGGPVPENYQRFFVPLIAAPLASDLVQTAAPRPGERVLDVPCRTGHVARRAAHRVGAAGAVTALDPDPDMLDVARAITPPGQPIEWRAASAAAIPLPDDTFDVALCQSALQFAPDREKVMDEIRRVLTPGGRLVLNVPGPMPSLFAVAGVALERHIGPHAAALLRSAFSLHRPTEIQGLAMRAGFWDVEVRVRTRTLTLPPPETFLWQYVAGTPLAEPMARVDDATRAELEREVVDGWQPFVDGEGMRCEHRITTAVAHK